MSFKDKRCPMCKLGDIYDEWWDRGKLCPCCGFCSWRPNRNLDIPWFPISEKALNKISQLINKWHELNPVHESDWKGQYTGKLHEYVGLTWGEFLFYQMCGTLVPESEEKILKYREIKNEER